MKLVAAAVLILPLVSCASYNAYEKARGAEKTKDWDVAVAQYQKALDVDPDNMRFRMGYERAKLESSRVHFQRGKTLRATAESVAGAERIRLAELAATELQITIKLDSTNQYAGVEFGKAVRMVQETRAALTADTATLDQMKKRANLTKAQPPVLNPASTEPISLSFPRDTPVKDIYRALGNAFGINILFDQGVKDDRISIELKDVTAQQALERVMQAANHFYKVLDEHTIIIVPDNPQARRDYEDLVIRTFYLSNGDAEQVTNVVRTMIEARNVFPLKALNAITIRDTADKVRIAEKIIEANDKAKAEVVVDVELLQLDLNKTRNLGMDITGTSGVLGAGTVTTDTTGKSTFNGLSSTTLQQLRSLNSTNYMFSMPSLEYSLVKSIGNAELLANPELRISEGEKATLHIGNRIPVPVSTFTSVATAGSGGTYAPVTSFQYQDVGIKVSMEPRVHHNGEVTLKLTVEVSNQGPSVSGGAGQPAQPTFATRTIESTIRLKDGETNFLAGLIQDTKTEQNTQTPFLADIPIIGRLFTNQQLGEVRTDLVLTMTPHIIRMPDITDDDLAPMWVGTQNNLTFRGVSPRVESQSNIDPFTPASATNPAFRSGATGVTPPGGMQLTPTGGANLVTPQGTPIVPGAGPTNPFNPSNVTPAPPRPKRPAAQPQGELQPSDSTGTAASQPETATAAAMMLPENSDAALRLAPRIGPQPSNLDIKPGEEKVWSVVGMDLDGLTADELLLHFDPRAMNVAEVLFGNALIIDPKAAPTATIDGNAGIVRIKSMDGKPLQFTGGGNVIALRVRGGLTGETFLVMENPNFHDLRGTAVTAAVAGGRAKVD
jgi:general secretion pathway protein D